MTRAGLGWRVVAGGLAGLAGGFVLLPVLALLLSTPPGRLLRHLADPAVRTALALSLVTSTIALGGILLVGLPAAWWMASTRSRAARWLEGLLLVPLILPPTVAGLGLLLAFGRAGLLGRTFTMLGVTIAFTPAAVVVAQLFVGLPFFVLAAAAGMRAVDRQLLDVGATLRSEGLDAFRRIVVPLARPSLVAGAAMAWARALGEFGATITFAGNVPGRTQTMPLAVYAALEHDLDLALALAVILLAVSAGILLAVRPWLPVLRGSGHA